MGDRTAFQVYVIDCPEDQRRAVAEILDDMQSEDAGNVAAYAVYDETRTADGKPITRRYTGDPLTVAMFPADPADGETEQQAKERALTAAGEYVATLPDGAERYTIDRVELATIGEMYMNPEMSCGSADEYHARLMEAAPGASWVLWEDPKYEWLGSMNAYAPDLGEYGSECDANGQPVKFPGELREIVAGCRDAVQVALDPVTELDADADRAQLAINVVLAAIDHATGRAWLDRAFPPGEPRPA